MLEVRGDFRSVPQLEVNHSCFEAPLQAPATRLASTATLPLGKSCLKCLETLSKTLLTCIASQRITQI